ncbi:MAG: hypothetical protein HQM14_07185 [SAR324 cluster bacterium]|nr:hypothetical protein [SAR324 cluster bacterium]
MAKPLNSDLVHRTRISTLDSIRGVEFDWKNGNGEAVGIVAQEVQSYMRRIVSEDEDGYLGVQYASLTPYLVEAVKEQRQIIEQQKQEHESELAQLQTKLQQQQNEINALKNQMAQMDQKIEQKLAELLNSIKTEQIASNSRQVMAAK